MIPIRSYSVITLYLLRNPLEYNLHLDPLCGESYTFVNLLPYKDKKSVSLLDDSSREDEENENFPMDKNLPKDET